MLRQDLKNQHYVGEKCVKDTVYTMIQKFTNAKKEFIHLQIGTSCANLTVCV